MPDGGGRGRFRFRLDPVLELRHREEEARQLTVANAGRALRVEEEHLTALGADYSATSLMLRERHRSLDAHVLQAAYAHLEFVSKRMSAQEEVVAQARSRLAAARAELLRAAQARQILETLKVRRKESFEAAARASEQRDLDEANLRRARDV